MLNRVLLNWKPALKPLRMGPAKKKEKLMVRKFLRPTPIPEPAPMPLMPPALNEEAFAQKVAEAVAKVLAGSRIMQPMEPAPSKEPFHDEALNTFVRLDAGTRVSTQGDIGTKKTEAKDPAALAAIAALKGMKKK